ncbi:hypothetical protein BC643_1998 [Mangrovibacterium diazotrophicum]|uniref:Uncharacterized protein n=1 Tax=Mangrovibacterium diazotrophicum TaxID=1261403 RepID=A0A419W833_9BACT|nr:hypothetical protein BC643_1998 [Mangrovibacterium diazotrophicum]
MIAKLFGGVVWAALNDVFPSSVIESFKKLSI